MYWKCHRHQSSSRIIATTSTTNNCGALQLEAAPYAAPAILRFNWHALAKFKSVNPSVHEIPWERVPYLSVHDEVLYKYTFNFTISYRSCLRPIALFTADILRYAVILTFDPFTFNFCSTSGISWGQTLYLNLSEIKQSAAQLLMIYQLFCAAGFYDFSQYRSTLTQTGLDRAKQNLGTTRLAPL